MTKYIPVIGLEIHVELSTKSKMFCGCPAEWFGKAPNTQTCPVCLGLPGALPVANKKAIDWTILLSQALNCRINTVSKFDRKHYFYPDLPKGYQISQYDGPLAEQGKFEIRNPKFEIEKEVIIRRIHLEEDTGKLIHEGEDTLIDFNRSGVPLVEIVTEPVFDNSDDVKHFLEELQVLVRYLGISDADMEKGSMRLEPNISLRASRRASSADFEGIATSSHQGGTPHNDKSNLPKYKVEVKNINSFRFAAAAIEYEILRQSEILDKGETPVQETRGYDSVHKRTVSQRSKEEAHDYRYFPEPDIPPLEFTESELSEIKGKMPDLPDELRRKFVAHGIPYGQVVIIVRNLQQAKVLNNALKKSPNEAKEMANVLVNKRGGRIEFGGSIDTASENLIKFTRRVNLPKETDKQNLLKAIDVVISKNQQAVSHYKSGKENALQFLIGQVMKAMKNQADANVVKEAIVSSLKKI